MDIKDARVFIGGEEIEKDLSDAHSHCPVTA